jgi:hypothetical protein
MVRSGSLQQTTVEVQRAIDDINDTLRWCKKHLHERKALDVMRICQLNLGYLALALDWQMEGDAVKSDTALRNFWWEPHRETGEQFLMMSD